MNNQKNKSNLILNICTKSKITYSIQPKKRNINDYINKGLIVINKVRGPTSHELASFIKKILNINKVGHSGSLDPKVTGVQPIMLSKATKAVQILRLSGKEYICFLKLHRIVPENNIKKVISDFEGIIYQTPPVKSAVKRKLRKKKIYYIYILEMNKKNILLKIGCEAGTYIRKLCHDIGLALGVGAHMQELVRSKVGPFEYRDCITIQKLSDAYDYWIKNGDESKLRDVIIPMEEAFKYIPKIIIKETSIPSISNGFPLKRPGIISIDENIKNDDIVCLFSSNGEIISLAKSMMNTKEISNIKKGIVAKQISVFINKINK